MVRGEEGDVGLWVWVGVLIVPVALTVGGFLLNKHNIENEAASTENKGGDRYDE
jgi:hypothetical protein